MEKRHLWNKFWKDKKGRLVVWQRPNLLLITWFAASVAIRLIDEGQPEQLLRVIAFGAIFAWAYLEITRGVSYFRRLLGAVVLILSVSAQL